MLNMPKCWKQKSNNMNLHVDYQEAIKYTLQKLDDKTASYQCMAVTLHSQHECIAHLKQNIELTVHYIL